MNTAHIWTDPERMGGLPCLRGHRLPMDQIARHVARHGIDDLLENWDYLDRFEVEAALLEWRVAHAQP
jgi:uncharacterized protein (DUF433 family)